MKGVGLPICSCSEQALQAECVGRGKLQVGAGETRPFFRRARIRFEQMGDCETCAQGRAMAPVETEEIFGQAILQCGCGAALDMFADPGTPQAFAFDAEEGDLVERIDRPEPRIELQAVDDPHRIGKPNMFGAQIAMPVDDVTVSQAIGDQLRSLLEEPLLGLIDPPDEPGGKAEARVEENPLVID